MKIKEIRDMKTEELRDKLAEFRTKVRELRFGLQNRQVKNIREIRTTKIAIARLSTILNDRKRSEVK